MAASSSTRACDQRLFGSEDLLIEGGELCDQRLLLGSEG